MRKELPQNKAFAATPEPTIDIFLPQLKEQHDTKCDDHHPKT